MQKEKTAKAEIQDQSESVSVYQMKVTIIDIIPSVWRRFLVTSDQTLYNLHLILQTIMGWENYHLYRFVADDIVYGEPDYEYEPGIESADRYRLSNIIGKERQKLLYVYDYGDNWRHEIEIEKILSLEPNISYPVCIAGENACPPEYCGGVSGYADMLEIIKDRENDEYEDMITWLGGGFDPAAFDLASINKELIRNASQWQVPLTLYPSDSPGFLSVPPIDRLVAIIKPKEPLLKWLQSQPDWDVDMTLDGLMSYCMAILIPLFDSDKESLKYVERNHRKIFMMILDGWYHDPDVWPKVSLRLFRQWFSVEIHTIVFDIVNKPIKKLGELD